MPSARDQVQMAYDPALQEVVLFGGYDPHVRADGDTWVYHDGAWKDLTSSLVASPPARWGGAFTYDPQLQALVLFGGRSLDRFFHDTWYFDVHGWHLVTTTTQPSERGGVAMAYDPLDHYLLLFGGGKGNLPAGSGSPWTYYNDTWELSGGVWHRLPTSPLAPRAGMHMVYDPVNRYMMFTGGAVLTRTGTSVGQHDTWSYVGGIWTKLQTRGAPPVLSEGGCLAWDARSGFAVLFGGEESVTEGNQTWRYSSDVWTNLTGSLGVTPPLRGNCGIAFDPADHYLFMFGGDTPAPNYAYYNDSWRFK
jgi:hypothetical protein